MDGHSPDRFSLLALAGCFLSGAAVGGAVGIFFPASYVFPPDAASATDGLAWLRFLLPPLLLFLASLCPCGVWMIPAFFLLRGIPFGLVSLRLMEMCGRDYAGMALALLPSCIALLAFFLIGEDCFRSVRVANAARRCGLKSRFAPISLSRIPVACLLYVLYVVLPISF